ncbi:MAG: hydrolase [Candidatus Nitrosotenuis sp.]
MVKHDKDQLIQAQNELIGVLFEIIKRMQSNNNLDEEYFQLVSSEKQKEASLKRLEEILTQRQENSKIIARLLEKIQT